MLNLVLAAVVFLALHLLVAGTRLRDVITHAIGEQTYLGLFSLASVVAIVWLAVSYNAAQASGPNPLLYTPWTRIRDLGIPVIALAFLFAVPGLLMPNPASVKQEGAAAKQNTIRGILRITRHPFLWGVALWSAFHLSANGDEASMIFFATFLLLSVLGTVSIDSKRRRKMGDGWENFSSRTSNIPFGAIIAGRNKFNIAELLDWRILLAIIAFLAVLFSHAHLFGVSPLPWTSSRF